MADVLKESAWTKLCKDNPSIVDTGLAAALKEYGKQKGKEVDEQVEALEEVVAKAEEVKRKNAKSKIKDVNGYLDDVLTDARQELARLESEDPDSDWNLTDEDEYRTYLKTTMKKLAKKPMYFAMGLGQKADDHRVIFHKSKDGKKLWAALKSATDLKKFAFGLASGHAEQTSTLIFALESPQISGLKKKGELLLKYFKPLAFDTIALMVNGEFVEDIPDAEDEAVTRTTDTQTAPLTEKSTTTNPSDAVAAQKLKLAGALKQLKPSVDKAIEADPNRKNELFESMTQIAGEIKDGKVEEAKSNIVALGKLVQGLLSQKRPPTDTESAKLRATYEELKTRLEPKLLDAIKANPEKANGLSNLWNYATDQGDAENFGNAATALGRLEGAILKAIEDAPKRDTDKFGTREGLVAAHRDSLEAFFKERLAKAKANTEAHLTSVEKSISAQLPDEGAVDLAAGIRSYLDDLYEQVSDDIAASIAKDSPDKVLKKMVESRKAVETDELVQHLQKSQKALGTNADFLDDFNQLFADVTDKLNDVTASST